MTQPTADRPTGDIDRDDPRVTVLADDLDEVHTELDDAGRRLLGGTISVGDDDWRAPSALPGWTRAHVASHLCRHADAFGRLVDGALTGTDAEMYPNDRDAEIEAGADRDGLAIQTDLDLSIGRLGRRFAELAAVDGWQRPVRLRDGSIVPAAGLPLGRLFEVVVHHIDLAIGPTFDDLGERTAELCLRWAAARQRTRTDYPALRLSTDSGADFTIGANRADDPITVGGPATRLLGWLTGRTDQAGLAGPRVELPSLG